MSDDLVKRLREDQPVTQDMGSTMQCALQDAAADRIEELEAKLAKAVTRLQHIAANKTTDELTVIEWDTHDTFTILDACISEARTTLAELTSSEAAYGEAKGGKDE